ncbi:MAG: class I SAM-dependent methyltransferase [Acidobacteriales bacterium]|nr:class I SAM-dependent methyltransferase [Terriglobales bacterium]
MQNEEVQVPQRIQHPWPEILRRARDPRFIADCAQRLAMEGWDLISPSEFSSLYRQIRNYTMCSNARLRGLYRGVRYAVHRDIPGDVVECGCARGGSAALMGLTIRQLKSKRKLWLFDSFEGLPAPTIKDPDFELADLFTGTCIGTLEEVRRLFHRLNLADDAEFVKGLFRDTLPHAPLSKIAVLHIDGDWYESVKVCLESLYDKVVPNGYIQLDDYGYWKGARRAVDEFFAERGIEVNLRTLDYSGRFFIKPPSTLPVSLPQQPNKMKLRSEDPVEWRGI